MNFDILKNFIDSLTDWIMPGNSVVVYKDNQKVFEYSSGYADLENKVKMDTNKLINIYSCSKVATVTAALQLVDAGKISLDDPLYKYIPEFENMYIRTKDGNAKCDKPITIWNLFTMTAGFNYSVKSPCFQTARELTNGKMDTLTVIKCLAAEPIDFEPGSSWKYSLCHDVLAAVVEVVSGMRFSEYVRQNIFLPLEMNNSYYHSTPEIEAKMAQQYVYDVNEDDIVKMQMGRDNEQNGVIRNVGLGNYLVLGENYDSGGAGIITTVDDYAKLAAALANYGKGVSGERILSKKAVELLKKNQINERHLSVFSTGRMQGYGYGLGVRTLMDKNTSGSNGSLEEFGWGGAAGANILIDCELNLGLFYAHHMLNPQEDYYQPRLRNALYSSLNG